MYEYQYGKSRTAIVLAQLISEHPEPEKIQRKVGRLLAQYNDVLVNVDKLAENHCTLAYLYKLTFRDHSEKAKALFGEGKIATYTINVMSIRKKQGLERSVVSVRAAK